MSLVDYASSDDDDDVVPVDPVGEDDKAQPQGPQPRPSQNQFTEPSEKPEPEIVKLPDASELLNSSEFSYSSLSGQSASSSSSRKRDPVGLASSLPRSKVPKGSLSHSKSVPDTVGGILVPPQLRGRSNVVTEDINKLFVKKQVEPSSK
ncbi:hypothetical protein G4B88_009764 [Cannabis sativa]|uniref:Uncharacterized protein n=1 Tax=Cannabis sativa TaxID=3483 RepID=A0A7J6E4C1_CANSA|nr:hypothetical protein G4B88_009764 [Cannabis sativa]